MKGLRLRIVAVLLLAVCPAFTLAGERESDLPVLTIISTLPAADPVRVFNEERVRFFARAGARETGPLLRGVEFVLYDHGKNPARDEFVRCRKRDDDTWGRPPSSFGFPLHDVTLPAGRYRLRAVKAGYRFAEVGVVYSRFYPYEIRTDHTAEHYRASFRIRLVDMTEKRKVVPVKVLMETADGGLLDECEAGLTRNDRRAGTYETRTPVKLSSKLRTPDRERPADSRTGVLKIVPGARLVLVLDGIRFSYPVPLPSEAVLAPGKGTAPRGAARGR